MHEKVHVCRLRCLCIDYSITLGYTDIGEILKHAPSTKYNNMCALITAKRQKLTILKAIHTHLQLQMLKICNFMWTNFLSQDIIMI